MRRICTGLAAILLAAHGEHGSAQTPPAQQADVIVVEAAATGVSIDPADKATVMIGLRKAGATSLEARTSVRAFADQLTGELVTLGIAKQNIDFEEAASRMGFIGNETIAAVMQDAGAGTPAVKRPVWAIATLKLTVSDLSLLPRLRLLIDQKDAVVMESPVFSLNDDRRARNAAIADGVRKARLDADAYAAALGMRVGRIISANDQPAQSSSSFPDYDRMIERFTGQSDVKSGMVRTTRDVVVKAELKQR